MIEIVFTPKDGGKPTVMEVDESVNDAFHVLGRIEARMGLVAAEKDPVFDRILALRRGRKPFQPLHVVPFSRSGQALGQDLGGTCAAATGAPARVSGVRDASLIAYRSLEWSERMTKQQRLVMDFLASNPHRDFTRRELSEALEMGINVICGRVNELLKEPFELIEELPRRRCRVTAESAHALRARQAQGRLAA